jgi:hypothetical protein
MLQDNFVKHVHVPTCTKQYGMTENFQWILVVFLLLALILSVHELQSQSRCLRDVTWLIINSLL